MKNSGLLSATAQEKIEKLPFFMRYVIYKLVECIDDIINGKCDEETLVSTLSTINNNANGRYGKEDLMYYDEAGKTLGFGATNRIGLKRLLDRNGIKEVKIGSLKVGFKRSEIMLLRDKIQSGIIKR